MTKYIVDEIHRSIHNYENINHNRCNVTSLTSKDIVLLFNENEIKDLVLNSDYNGCPFCLKKYYLERKFSKMK